tara:strand:- start:9605 stop:10240 length:636 start_codon:yes stop_codon:yes gene_type:complete
MHKNFYNIKVALMCHKSFSNSIEELKPFFGFDLKEIDSKTEVNSINLENQVLITDSSFADKTHFDKISIPKILILKQKEKNTSINKFDIVIKLPLHITQFIRTVIDLSQKHKFSKNSFVKVKEYILDKNARFLNLNEKSMKITEKEMHFIEELNNSPKPLTKDYILKNIWGYSSETDTHTVETHIYRLRQKIKNHFDDENFIKHTKEGYSF